MVPNYKAEPFQAISLPLIRIGYLLSRGTHYLFLYPILSSISKESAAKPKTVIIYSVFDGFFQLYCAAFQLSLLLLLLFTGNAYPSKPNWTLVAYPAYPDQRFLSRALAEQSSG